MIGELLAIQWLVNIVSQWLVDTWLITGLESDMIRPVFIGLLANQVSSV